MTAWVYLVDRCGAKFIEGRNLLAENDLYRRYEFTFLRQLVIIINLVTEKPPIFSILAAFLAYVQADL
jgi:hypothetical protein